MGLHGLQYKEVDPGAGDSARRGPSVAARRARAPAGVKGPGRSCADQPLTERGSVKGKPPPVFAEKWSLN